MIAFIRECAEGFRREKVYTFLFLFVLAFLLVSYLADFFLPIETKEITLDDSIRSLEQLMEMRSKDPAFLEKRFEEDPILGWASRIFMMGFALACFVGFAANIILIGKFFRKEPWPPSSEQAPDISWGLMDVFKSVTLFMFYGIFLNVLLLPLRTWFPERLPDNLLLLLHTTLIDLLMVWFVYHFIGKLQRKPWVALGFKRSVNWLKECWLGIKAYILLLPSFMLLLLIVIHVSDWLNYEPPTHPLVTVFIEEEKRSPWLVGYSLLFACLIGPFLEEIFFRGFLYPAIKKRGGMAKAVLLTSLLFALVHGNSVAFLPIFLLSSALCYLYEKRRNLVACWSLHVVHNGVFVLYFLLMKKILLTDGALQWSMWLSFSSFFF